MKDSSLVRIRQALGSTKSWPRLCAAARALTDAELERAEEFERLGRRRANTLRVLHAEQQRRAGHGHKMLRLEMEMTR